MCVCVYVCVCVKRVRETQKQKNPNSTIGEKKRNIPSPQATEKEETAAIGILIYFLTGIFPVCTSSDFHLFFYSAFVSHDVLQHFLA